MSPVETQAAINAEQPWPGLLPFTEEAQAFFHGRDEEGRELLRGIKRATLTVLFGQSGLGKSSLLRAGLFPQLRAEDYLPVYIRLQLRDDAPPLGQQVRQAIEAECTQRLVECPELPAADSLWELFHRRDADFWSARNRLLTPVLVFDQFEEIFTLGHGLDSIDRRCERFVAELADLVEHRIPAALAQAAGGDAALPAAVDVSRDTVRVVFSFREDFLAEFEGLRPGMPSIMRNRVRLARMSAAQAKAAVLLSGRRLVSEAVADEIVHFVSAPRGGARRGDSAGGSADVEPALLSVVCRELNNRRRVLGRAEISNDLLQGSAQQKIISDFYEGSFVGIDPRLREFVEGQLLTEGGFRDSYAYDDALRQPGVLREQVDRLIERRLLRLEERAGVLRLELTHDLLTEVARESRDHRHRTRAESAQRERDELRRRRVRRLVALGVAASVVAVGLIVTFAVLLRQSDRERQRLAHTQSEVLLERANGLFDQGVPGEPQSRLERALELDPGHRNAIARALTYLHQRGFASRLAAPQLPPQPGMRATDVQWLDADRVLITHEHGETAIAVPAAARAGAASAARLAPALELPSPAALASWQPGPGPKAFVSAGNHLVWLEAGRELRSGLSQGGQVLAGVAVEQARAPVVLSADGSRAMLRSGARSVLVFALAPNAAPRPLHVLAAGQGSLRHGPGGRRLLALDGATATSYDLDTDQLQRFQHPLAVNALALGPDGRTLATAAQDQFARLWDLASGALLVAPLRHEGAVLSVAFSMDGSRLITGAKDGTARVWAVASGRPLVEPLLGESAVSWARFSPDGSHAVLHDDEGRTSLWRLSDLSPLQARLQLPGPVVAAAFDPGASRIATALADGQLALWQLQQAQGPAQAPVPRWQRALGTVRRMALAPTGDTLVVATADHRLHWLDAATGRELAAPAQHEGEVLWLQFSADGALLATGAADGAARVFDVATRQRVGLPVAPRPDPVIQAALAPGGRHLLTVTVQHKRRSVWLWSLQRRLPVELGSGVHVALVAFTAEREIVTVIDATVRRWTLSDDGEGAPAFEPRGTPLTLGHLVWSAALSADRQHLVLGGLNGVTRTVSMADWRAIGDPMKSAGVVGEVALSDSGQWLLTRDATDTLRVWNSSSGIAVSDPLDRPGQLLAAYIDAQGRQAVAVGAGGELWVQRLGLDFPLPMPPWLAQLVSAAGGATLDQNGSIAWDRDREARLARMAATVGDAHPWWQGFGRHIMVRLGAAQVGTEGAR